MGQDQKAECPRCVTLPAGEKVSQADGATRICDPCADNEQFLIRLTGSVNPVSTWPADVRTVAW